MHGRRWYRWTGGLSFATQCTVKRCSSDVSPHYFGLHLIGFIETGQSTYIYTLNIELFRLINLILASEFNGVPNDYLISWSVTIKSSVRQNDHLLRFKSSVGSLVGIFGLRRSAFSRTVRYLDLLRMIHLVNNYFMVTRGSILGGETSQAIHLSNFRLDFFEHLLRLSGGKAYLLYFTVHITFPLGVDDLS